jgi:hypothetical protein
VPAVIDIPLTGDALGELAGMLLEKFQATLTARSNQVDDKLTRWGKNYAGTPMQEVRTTPFNRASNFMPQLIRMHADILSARVLGIIFGTKPFWMPKTLRSNELPHEQISAISEGVNYLFDSDLDWFSTVDEIINGSFQTGTLVLKMVWSDESRQAMEGGQDQWETIDEKGMIYDPLPFQDFWPYPITAKTVDSAEIAFHRIRKSRRDVEDRKKSKLWIPEAADLMFPERRSDPAGEAVAENSGINLTPDVDYPYSAIEAWLDYDIAGVRRPIVVVFNPMVKGVQSILKAYYNFMPRGKKAFREFTPMPRRGSFFGYAVPEVLEQSQEEVAQIHNARRDGNMIANVPGWKKKRHADVPNPATEWYPGCVIELDEMDDLEPLQFGGNYNSMLDEEQFVMSWAEKLIGISPAMQGYGAGQAAGKRGVYATGATMALLSEGNQRLDIFIRRLRAPFHHVANTTMSAYQRFYPDYFKQFGDNGNAIAAAIDAGTRSGKLLYDLSASEASSNRETDRQNLLQMANVVGPYYQQILGAAQLYNQLPPNDPTRPIISSILSGARDLAQRILFAFNIGDRDRILPDVSKILEGGAGPIRPAQPGGLPGPAGIIQPSELENILKATRSVSGGVS